MLKAHVTTGLSIGNIESQLAAGATVAKDGTLVPAPDETLPPIDPTERPATAEPENTPLSGVLPTQNAESASSPTVSRKERSGLWVWVIISMLFVGCAFAVRSTIGKYLKKTEFSAKDPVKKDSCSDRGDKK